MEYTPANIVPSTTHGYGVEIVMQLPRALHGRGRPQVSWWNVPVLQCDADECASIKETRTHLLATPSSSRRRPYTTCVSQKSVLAVPLDADTIVEQRGSAFTGTITYAINVIDDEGCRVSDLQQRRR